MPNEYWDEFIPAMLPTRLGSSTDGDPQLAAAWLGWQERRKIDDARITELEAALKIIASYTGKDEAALVAKQLAQSALNREGEPT